MTLLQKAYNRDENHEGHYLERIHFAIGISYYLLQWAFGVALDFQPGLTTDPVFNINTDREEVYRLPARLYCRASFGPFALGIRLGRDNPKMISNYAVVNKIVSQNSDTEYQRGYDQ